ncbi:MAG: hypothetical protein COA42_01895 [Alteromonadaceae bacterium]|nr:MAG: hypothetical protein COA42_01895 [Alteromonadaceae bacterium]
MAVTKQILAMLATYLILNLSSCNPEHAMQSDKPKQVDRPRPSQFLSADDDRLTYVGRFHRVIDQGITEMRSTWPGTLVRFQAKLQTLSVEIRETDEQQNRYKILIDGEVHTEISPRPDQLIYPVISDFDASKSHEFTIYKVTEYPEAAGAFQGIYLDAEATISKARPRKRVIEFIGDSNTVGYGNISKTRENCDPWTTTDNHLSYARQIGDHFDADVYINARSGIGMVQNYGNTDPSPSIAMPQIYKRTLQHQATPEWDFASVTPDLVIVALGANDLWDEKYEPSKELFQTTYQQFLTTLYKYYPADTRYLLLGDNSKNLQTRVKEIVAQEIRDGRKYTGYSKQYHSNTKGCNWHPDKNSHKKAVKKLSTDISGFMGWG